MPITAKIVSVNKSRKYVKDVRTITLPDNPSNADIIAALGGGSKCERFGGGFEHEVLYLVGGADRLVIGVIPASDEKPKKLISCSLSDSHAAHLAYSPDKTFGLKSATDLYLKLLFDIERLRSASGTKTVQYAAFDCAVTAAHILDWVLRELDNESHVRLTGVGKDEKHSISGFIKRNREILGGLEFCRQISNSVKHMIITMGPVKENMSTGSTVMLESQGDRFTRVYAHAYIKIDGEKHPVIELFEDTAEQWRRFLVGEGLWVEQPPEQED